MRPQYGWDTEAQCLVYLESGEPVGTDPVEPAEGTTEIMHYRTTIPGINHSSQKVVAFCGDQTAVLATTERGRVDCKLCLMKMKRTRILR